MASAAGGGQRREAERRAERDAEGEQLDDHVAWHDLRDRREVGVLFTARRLYCEFDLAFIPRPSAARQHAHPSPAPRGPARLVGRRRQLVARRRVLRRRPRVARRVVDGELLRDLHERSSSSLPATPRRRATSPPCRRIRRCRGSASSASQTRARPRRRAPLEFVIDEDLAVGPRGGGGPGGGAPPNRRSRGGSQATRARCAGGALAPIELDLGAAELDLVLLRRAAAAAARAPPTAAGAGGLPHKLDALLGALFLAVGVVYPLELSLSEAPSAVPPPAPNKLELVVHRRRRRRRHLGGRLAGFRHAVRHANLVRHLRQAVEH